MSGSIGYLPLFHDIRGVNVLVVGGGTVATRKVETLLAREAIVERSVDAIPYKSVQEMTDELFAQSV